MSLTPELDLSGLQAGFAEPVQDAQRCFRSVLDALAHPGSSVDLQDMPAPPLGLGAAQTAVLLTLADQDTPVWLPPALRCAAAGHYLRFHCGCRLATSLDEASFVLPASLAELPALDDLRLGDPAFPDRSATLVIEVDGLAEHGPLRLRGPGIAAEARLSVAGWTPACTTFMQENRQRFPLGADLLLTHGNRLVGLPRSVVLTQEG